MIIRTHDHIENKFEMMRELQLTMTIMEQDIQQIINRPILTETGQEQPAIIVTEDFIEFTRSGWINPFEMNKRSTLGEITNFPQNRTSSLILM